MGIVRLPLIRLKSAASISTRLFSSSAAPIRRPWAHSSDSNEDSIGESAIYKRALKLQRPTTVQYHQSLSNSVSLIGAIEFPLKECKSLKFGVHTLLKVKASTGAFPHFRVMLKFWDELAEMSVQHLKPCDLVYVSGRLGSYTKVDENGKSIPFYEVDVTEVNFVAQHGVQPACQNLVKFEPQVSTEERIQNRRSRLHLWQIFFANPSEWWDRRSRKTNPRAPDFKHKDTGESLWLNESDPPWISKQLQLHDSRSREQSQGENRNAWSHLSPLVYDDTQDT
ncbi:hypothetical protein ACP275_03G051600 [Erythranthe tilingii]